ncbi:MAG TPA: DUF5985 family protein [Burkholderiaceae bacterium]|nr:DUF5985 family protein [Burkholderiaceae bacterium]
MYPLLIGMVAMASAIASLFFLKFWRQTRDRFFLLFALAFALDCVSRITLGVGAAATEHEPLFYAIRLVSFVLIIIAIVDKNLRGR